MPRIRTSPIPASAAAVIDVLENGCTKDQRSTLSHYLTAARMIPMRIDLWNNLERVFFAGIAEEEDATDAGYTPEEKHIYAQIVEMIPIFRALMPAFQGHSNAFERFVELIKDSALNSRTGDTNTCKKEVLKLWLPSGRLKQILRERGISTVKLTDSKSQRGWNDAQCALQLLPLRLHEKFFEDPQKLLLDIRSSNVKIRASEFPSFLYPEATLYDRDKALVGLFRGPLLVRMYRCIFTSPSSALNPHEKGNSKTQAEIHKIKHVKPYGIAYAAVMTRQALSSSDWVGRDFHFDYRDFMDRILRLFEDPTIPWVGNTLNWWNKQVDFSRSKASASSSDDDSDDEHAVSIDELLRSAVTEEDLEGGQDNGGNRDGSEGCQWPDDFRTEEEIAAAQEQEAAREQEVVAARTRERETAAQEQEATAARERQAREQETAARERQAREQETVAQEQQARERETAAREQEVTAARERQARERETAAREQEVTAVQERQAREQETVARERQARERETAAREQERAATAAAREQETTASGKRKGLPDPDLSDLSEEEDLPPPRPVKTNQTNRGTGRQPPPRKKKR